MCLFPDFRENTHHSFDVEFMVFCLYQLISYIQKVIQGAGSLSLSSCLLCVCWLFYLDVCYVILVQKYIIIWKKKIVWLANQILLSVLQSAAFLGTYCCSFLLFARGEFQALFSDVIVYDLLFFQVKVIGRLSAEQIK